MATWDDVRDRVLTLPPPMRWTRSVPAPNEAFELYRGALELRSAGKACSGQGSVDFRWFPFQHVAFTLALEPSVDLGSGSGELTLADFSTPAECHWGVNITFGESGRSAEAQGILTAPLRGGSLAMAERVTFAVPNFFELLGSAVAEEIKGALTVRMTRQALSAPPWELVLEGIAGQQEVLKTLEERGGYAITHLGSFRRVDGAALAEEEVLAILDDGAVLLSFARGSACSPVIAEGLTTHGQVCWRDWDAMPTQPWKKVLSWFPLFSPESMAALVPGFFDRLRRPGWRESLRNAIHWYVSANTWAGGTPGAIILAQTALELLGSACENDRGIAAYPPRAGKGASDGIRRLLAWAGIPSQVPSELPDLAQAGPWDDGPHALTAVRNAIVHPDPSRATLARPEVQSQAWLLGLEYVELVLLKLFGYRGEYKSRVRPGRLLADVQIVPWASEPMRVAQGESSNA